MVRAELSRADGEIDRQTQEGRKEGRKEGRGIASCLIGSAKEGSIEWGPRGGGRERLDKLQIHLAPTDNISTFHHFKVQNY